MKGPANMAEMKSFKIVFYKSEKGALVHMRTLYRMAAQLMDLVENPPGEFFEILKEFMPIHGWAEMEETRATVFVIFAPRSVILGAIDEETSKFREWLSEVKPSDFKPT